MSLNQTNKEKAKGVMRYGLLAHRHKEAFSDQQALTLQYPTLGQVHLDSMLIDVIDFRMFSAPGSGKIFFWVKIVNSGVEFSGDTGVSIDVPAATTGLAIHNWCNNNGTASAIDPHWMGYYLETDN